MSWFGGRAGDRALTMCVIAATACSDSAETPSGHPRSDASVTQNGDGGHGKDGGRRQDAGRGKDASLDGPASPAFGFSVRPTNTTCVAPRRQTTRVGVYLERPFKSVPIIPQPLGFLQAPNDASRWFIVQQRGIVLAMDNKPDATAFSTFVNIQARVNWDPDEAGLLGMAFDPNFATNGVVYLSYTGHGGPVDLTSHVSRFVSRDGGKTLDPDSEEILLSVEQPFENHNGGNIQFGPDGFLYIGFGDGGSAVDPMGNAQNRNVLLGKMLRIGVATAGPYTVPDSNPFASGGGKPEIFAVGFRNPWRWSFDRDTGDLWVGDVGQGSREEVDRVKRGGNYGWVQHEGTFCRYASCPKAGFVFPVAEYTHAEGLAIVGGYVYRGTAIPSLSGAYVYGDYITGKIYALLHDPLSGALQPTLIATAPGRISSFGQGVDGEIYVVLYTTGFVAKLVPLPATDAAVDAGDSISPVLSATGCVVPTDPTSLAGGVIPYDVNVPYWSDGVDMARAFAIPDGTKIKVLKDGRFDFPNGSVLMQTASRNGRRLHTRFLVRHDDGDWSGYAYEWNQAQTDATLIRGAKVVQDGSFGSYVTHPGECLACHTKDRGRILGFASRQVNRDFTYANGARVNQLSQLEHVGFFESSLPAAARAAPYPSLDGSESVDSRARAYLEVNCSMCHDRPSNSDGGLPDLRVQTSLTNTGLCNVTPQHGTLGLAGAVLVAAGLPARSILSLRMHTDDWSRMPPLESQVVDAQGAALVDEWITRAACPAPRSDGGG